MSKKKVEKKEEITTLVNFILDRSGSMGTIKDTVISGFNEYLQSLQQSKNPVKFSLTLFASGLGEAQIDKRYVAVDVDKVVPLSSETYKPNGNTPLYDAVVGTIESVVEKVDHAHDGTKYAIVTVIMTDGAENSSREHNQKCLKDLIQKLEEKGNWTFTFMGANVDAFAEAQKYGISKGNTIQWNSTEEGTRSVMRSAGIGLSTYQDVMAVNLSQGKDLKTSSFFAKTGGDKNDSQS